jgi:hypothetical protein
LTQTPYTASAAFTDFADSVAFAAQGRLATRRVAAPHVAAALLRLRNGLRQSGKLRDVYD